MQISSNYSMNGVPYENRRRQDNIPQFSTEHTEQENESINPYMADVDFNEKAFDMIGPNAPLKLAFTHKIQCLFPHGSGDGKGLSHFFRVKVGVFSGRCHKLI